MARDDDQEASDRPQDEIVGRLRPDPAQPPEPSVTLTGFLGDSDREGFRRLYFSRALDYYAEFRAEDVLATAAIPADQQPFAGEEATRVTLREAATVEYTRVRAARPVDEFDIDVRLGGRETGGPGRRITFARTCGEATCGIATCGRVTCVTCRTNCGGPTCAGQTCAGTCTTHCGTCGTCFGTCATCFTNCGTCEGNTCHAACLPM